VTPGIGKLGDLGYLNALQSMNRVILNPMFKSVFFSAVIFIPAAAALSYKSSPDHIFWMLLLATILYGLGTFGVTIWGNIPLNNLLDNTNLGKISAEDAKDLREAIELKWNRFNLIRTITSVASLVLLILTCLQINE